MLETKYKTTKLCFSMSKRPSLIVLKNSLKTIMDRHIGYFLKSIQYADCYQNWMTVWKMCTNLRLDFNILNFWFSSKTYVLFVLEINKSTEMKPEILEWWSCTFYAEGIKNKQKQWNFNWTWNRIKIIQSVLCRCCKCMCGNELLDEREL